MDSSIVWAWEARGMCELCSGDVSGARRSWGTAVELHGDSVARGWLASPDGGEIKEGLVAYR